MGKAHNPRRGSMQFWPRKRTNHSLVRIRSWAEEGKVKPLGFIGYKAGMTHLQVVDNTPKSLTKDQKIVLPSTIIECPPMTLCGVSFYQKSLFGLKKSVSILATKLDKALARRIQLPKKTVKSIDEIKEFDDLRILVHSNPKETLIGTKKPKLLEIALGGSKEEKLNYVKEMLGKKISVKDVFETVNLIDIQGVTKGKGFQGTVKRFGVPIRQHKGEKVKRGIGNLGAWTPKRVDFRVPQAGKMGYHQRMEYNKQILKIGDNGKDVNPSGGINSYGLIKTEYVLIKGSVIGPKKRAVVLSKARRPTKKLAKGSYQIVNIKK
tara:strand:+ start:502 stop:1464 length:963 start_codon:yes stop_codon:yes gene_type:complete